MVNHGADVKLRSRASEHAMASCGCRALKRRRRRRRRQQYGQVSLMCNRWAVRPISIATRKIAQLKQGAQLIGTRVLVCPNTANVFANKCDCYRFVAMTLTARSIRRHGTRIVSSITFTVLTNFSIRLTMLSRENSWSSLRAMRRREFLFSQQKMCKHSRLVCIGYKISLFIGRVVRHRRTTVSSIYGRMTNRTCYQFRMPSEYVTHTQLKKKKCRIQTNAASLAGRSSLSIFRYTCAPFGLRKKQRARAHSNDRSIHFRKTPV